jgi:hypothetical protein
MKKTVLILVALLVIGSFIWQISLGLCPVP